MKNMSGEIGRRLVHQGTGATLKLGIELQSD